MLKRPQKFFGIALLVLAVAIFLWVGSLAPSFEKCIAEHASGTGQYEASYPQQMSKRGFLTNISELLRCEAVFADENSALLTVIATIAIAAFTYTLWQATTTQGDLTRDSIKLAREEFLVSHRPELRIHSARLLAFSEALPPEQQFLRVEFGVINAGTSAGKVTGSAVYLQYFFSDGLPYLPRLTRNDIIWPQRYDVGATNTIEVASDGFGGANHVAWLENDTTKSLYLYGWVVYEDAVGVARTTYFTRVYLREDERFAPVADPERNCTY